nr:unnamed protein product [Naegleria fowleri]
MSSTTPGNNGTVVPKYRIRRSAIKSQHVATIQSVREETPSSSPSSSSSETTTTAITSITSITTPNQSLLQDDENKPSSSLTTTTTSTKNKSSISLNDHSEQHHLSSNQCPSTTTTTPTTTTPTTTTPTTTTTIISNTIPTFNSTCSTSSSHTTNFVHSSHDNCHVRDDDPKSKDIQKPFFIHVMPSTITRNSQGPLSNHHDIVMIPWTLNLDLNLLEHYQAMIGRCSECHEYVKRGNFEKHVQNDCKSEIETNFEEIQQQRMEELHNDFTIKIHSTQERITKLETDLKELTSQKMNLQNKISDLAKRRFMEENSQIVTLDVGGEIIQTSLSTLINREFEPESLLASMFENVLSSNNDSSMDEESTPCHHYIDCDPDHFSLVLHWLRYGNIRVDTSTGKLLVDVAEQFGLVNLKQQIESCELLKESVSKFGLSNINKTYNKIKQYEMDHLLSYSMKENVQLSLTNVDLRGVSLRDSQITNAVITYSNFGGMNLVGACFSGTNLSGCNFEKCNLTNVNLSGCNLTNVNFRNATLTNASLTGSILDGCILENCNLSNANLKACNLTTTSSNSTGYILANAKLNRAIVNADFLRKSKSLFGIDLSGCSLKKMDFSGLDFSYANLSNCILSQSNFTNTNFANANLSTSSLSECIFTGCNITGAKLVNSSLRNCDLTSIDPASVGYCVAGAKLQGAKYDNEFMNKATKLVRNKKDSYTRRNQSQENDLETLMLSDGYFYSILKVFAEKEYASENLLLWEKIKNLSSDFNNLHAVVNKDMLREIYNEYVKPSAPNEINFSSDCKKKFYSLIEPNSELSKHASIATTRESVIHANPIESVENEISKKQNEEVNVKSVMDLLWPELFMNIYDTFTRLQKTKQYAHWEKTSANVPFVTTSRE